MYGSSGHGRGRGSHHGRGSFHRRGQSHDSIGGQRRGPALPSSLLRELGGDDSSRDGSGGRGFRVRGDGARDGSGRSSGRGRGGRGGDGGGSDGGRQPLSRNANRGRGDVNGSRKRTAERMEDSGRADNHPQQDKGAPAAKRRLISTTNGDVRSHGGEKRGADPRVSGLTRTLAAMKQRQAGSGPESGAHGTSSKTKFHELLVDGWESRNGREAFLEELRLQARLAKKLGKSKTDTLDGMDKLTGLLSAGSGSLLPKYLDSESRREAEELLAKAGSGSGFGPDSLDPGLKATARSRNAGPLPADAAAAALQVAEMLDRESDEELEFLGMNPGLNRDNDDDDEGESDGKDEDVHGYASRSGSEDYDHEDEEEDDLYDCEGVDGGLDSGSEEQDDSDDQDDEGDGEDDEYDMFGQLMGSDSGEEEDGEAGDSHTDEDEGQEEAAEAEEEEEDVRASKGSLKSQSRSRSKREIERESNDEEEEGADHGVDGHEDEGEEQEDGDEEEGEEGGRAFLCGMSMAASAAAAVEGAGAAAVAKSGSAQQKYVPPALRTQLAAATGGGTVDAPRLQLERRITGLINRLAEANLQSISRDVADLYSSQGRRLVSEAVAAQILGAAESGPRASEQFAAVAAAFVAAVAAQAEAQDLAAGFLAELAKRLEAARHNGDSLAQANLVTLLAYCYSAGLLGAGLCYSFLATLKERFQETDVAGMVTLLNAVGLQLRNADPGLMKEFVLGVHEKAAQLGRDGQLSHRAQLMLDLIIDIKNNKTSAAGGAAAAAPNVSLGGIATRKGKGAAAAASIGAGGGGRRGGALAVLQPSVAKWLQQLGVEEVCLRGLTWPKLLSSNKKGMWWMPVAGEALDDPLLLAAAGAGVPGGGGPATAAAAAAATASTAKLLQLAATQRMSTDARKAVFVAIMGSEDCAEAHEKLLRLPLKGDQRREIMRVLVDCCLGEKAWNPYYAFLAVRLCGGGGGGGSVGRAHRVTMQYCLWDKFKEVESMDVRQLTHLAKLAALLVARFTLSLSLLKVVDWSDLSAKQLLTWRIFLQHLLSSCKTADVKEVFARVASQPKTLSSLITGLLLFLRTSFAPWAATKLPPGAESDELLRRTRMAEKELAAGATSAAAVLI